jgi:ABC-type Fe3+-siderophore transport system permease subunit
LVKQEPVNVVAQMIMGLIPLVSIYAFYRIQKLRKILAISILINITISFAVLGISIMMATISDDPESLEDSMMIMMEILENIYLNIVLFVVGIAINLYLMKKWATQWNEQFSESRISGDIK